MYAVASAIFLSVRNVLRKQMLFFANVSTSSHAAFTSGFFNSPPWNFRPSGKRASLRVMAPIHSAEEKPWGTKRNFASRLHSEGASVSSQTRTRQM